MYASVVGVSVHWSCWIIQILLSRSIIHRFFLNRLNSKNSVCKMLSSLWLIFKGESCAYVDTFTLLLPWLCSSPPCSRKNRLHIPVTRLVQCIVLHHFLPLFHCNYATTAIILFPSEPKLVWVIVSLNFVRSHVKSSVPSIGRN